MESKELLSILVVAVVVVVQYCKGIILVLTMLFHNVVITRKTL